MRRFRTIAVCMAVALAAGALSATAGASARPGAPARAATAAASEVGAPYLWGGMSPATGFDSSGLVVWAYGQAGITRLPHSTPFLWTSGRHVRRSALRPGDLVFFDHAEHVGIYLGNGRFVHAVHTGDPVSIDLLRGAYRRQYSGAVRITRSR